MSHQVEPDKSVADRRDEALRRGLSPPPQRKASQKPKVAKHPGVPAIEGKPEPTGEAS